MDRNFYQQLTETSPCGFAIVNVLCENNQANDYEFCQCNTAFLNHIGLQRRQVIGKKLKEIIPPEDHQKFDWLKAIASITIDFQKPQKTDLEQYIDYYKRWYRVRAFAPQPFQLIIYFIDITNEKNSLMNLNSFLMSATAYFVFSTSRELFRNSIGHSKQFLVTVIKSCYFRILRILFTLMTVQKVGLF